MNSKISLASIVFGLGLFFTGMVAMPSYASTSNTNSADYWSDVYNTTCIKFEPNETSQYGHLNSNANGIIVDAPLLALIVKGGSVNGGNAVYDNPTIGGNYLAPLNAGGQQSAVSHWIACLPPVTTTTAVVTTTSIPTTTTNSTTTTSTSTTSATSSTSSTTSSTSTIPTTTTIKGTTTTVETTVPEPEIGDAAVQVRGAELAETGFNSWILVCIGAALIVLGVVLVKKK